MGVQVESRESGHPARRHWRLDQRLIVRRVDLRAGEAAHWLTESDVERWLRNPVVLPVLNDMLRWTGGGGSASARASAELRARLLDAVRRRELVAVWERSHGAGGGAGQAATDEPRATMKKNAPPAEPPPRQKQEKTWIEIRLIDDAGKPMPYEPYKLWITDGSVREGKLDEQGRVRVEGLEAGMCRVTFPDIDAKEWSPA